MGKSGDRIAEQVLFKVSVKIDEWTKGMTQMAQMAQKTTQDMSAMFAGLSTQMRGSANQFSEVMGGLRVEAEKTRTMLNESLSGGSERGASHMFQTMNSAVNELRGSVSILNEMMKGFSATFTTAFAGSSTGETPVGALARKISNEAASMNSSGNKLSEAGKKLQLQINAIKRAADLSRTAVTKSGGGTNAGLDQLRKWAYAEGIIPTDDATKLDAILRPFATAREKALADERGNTKALGASHLQNLLTQRAQEAYAATASTLKQTENAAASRAREAIYKEIKRDYTSAERSARDVLKLVSRNDSVSEGFFLAATNDLKGFKAKYERYVEEGTALVETAALLQSRKGVLGKNLDRVYGSIRSKAITEANSILKSVTDNPIPKAISHAYDIEMQSLNGMRKDISVKEALHSSIQDELTSILPAQETFTSEFHKRLQSLFGGKGKKSAATAAAEELSKEFAKAAAYTPTVVDTTTATSPVARMKIEERDSPIAKVLKTISGWKDAREKSAKAEQIRYSKEYAPLLKELVPDISAGKGDEVLPPIGASLLTAERQADLRSRMDAYNKAANKRSKAENDKFTGLINSFIKQTGVQAGIEPDLEAEAALKSLSSLTREQLAKLGAPSSFKIPNLEELRAVVSGLSKATSLREDEAVKVLDALSGGEASKKVAAKTATPEEVTKKLDDAKAYARIRMKLAHEQTSAVIKALEYDAGMTDDPTQRKSLLDAIAERKATFQKNNNVSLEEASKILQTGAEQEPRAAAFAKTMAEALLKSPLMAGQIDQLLNEEILKQAAGQKDKPALSDAAKKSLREEVQTGMTSGLTSNVFKIIQGSLDPEMAVIRKVEEEIIAGRAKITGEFAKLPGSEIANRNAEGHLKQVLEALPQVFPDAASMSKFIKEKVLSKANVASAVSEVFFKQIQEQSLQAEGLKTEIDAAKASLADKQDSIIKKFSDTSKEVGALYQGLANAERQKANAESAGKLAGEQLLRLSLETGGPRDVMLRALAASEANASKLNADLNEHRGTSEALGRDVEGNKAEIIKLNEKIAGTEEALFKELLNASKIKTGLSKAPTTSPRIEALKQVYDNSVRAVETANADMVEFRAKIDKAHATFQKQLSSATGINDVVTKSILEAERVFKQQYIARREADMTGQGEAPIPNLGKIINDAMGLSGLNAITISEDDQKALVARLEEAVKSTQKTSNKYKKAKAEMDANLAELSMTEGYLAAAPAHKPENRRLYEDAAARFGEDVKKLETAYTARRESMAELAASMGGEKETARALAAAQKVLQSVLNEDPIAESIDKFINTHAERMLQSINKSKIAGEEQAKSLAEALDPAEFKKKIDGLRRKGEELAAAKAAVEYGGERPGAQVVADKFYADFDKSMKEAEINHQERLDFIKKSGEEVRSAIDQQAALRAKSLKKENENIPGMGIVQGNEAATRRATEEADNARKIWAESESAATELVIGNRLEKFREFWKNRKTQDNVNIEAETKRFMAQAEELGTMMRDNFSRNLQLPGVDGTKLQASMARTMTELQSTGESVMNSMAQNMARSMSESVQARSKTGERAYQPELDELDRMVSSSRDQLRKMYNTFNTGIMESVGAGVNMETAAVGMDRLRDSYADLDRDMVKLSRNAHDSIVKDRESEEKQVINSLKSSLGYEMEYHKERINAEKATIDRVVENRKAAAKAAVASAAASGVGAAAAADEVKRAETLAALADRAKASKDDQLNQIKALHGPLQATARGLMSLSYQLSHVAMQAQMQGAALMGMVYSVVHFSTEYEKQMALLKGALEKVGEPTAKLQTDMKALANESARLGQVSIYSVSEIAETQKVLAHAGLTVNEVISSTPRIMDMAAAGEMKLAEAANTAVVAMRQFGLGAEQMGRVTNVITTTAIATSSEVKGMAEALKYVGPIASNLGMSLEETTTALGLLANAGIKGSMGGTTLRRMLTALANPTKRENEVLKDLNIEIENLEGNFVGLFPVLQQIQRAMGNATKIQISKEFMQLFQQRAGAGAAALFNMLKDQPKVIEELMAATDQYGKDQLVATERTESLEGAVTRLKNSFIGLNVIVGEQTNGMLKYLVEAATSAVQIFGELIKGGEGATSTMSKVAVGTAALFGTALTFFATASFAISGLASGFSIMLSSLASLGSGFGIFKALYVGVTGLPAALLQGATGVKDLAARLSMANTAGLAFANSLNKTTLAIEAMMANNIGVVGWLGRLGFSAGALSATLTGLQLAITGISIGFITAGIVAGIAAWISYRDVVEDAEKALVGFQDELNNPELAPKYFDTSSVIRGTTKELIEIWGAEVMASASRVGKIKDHLVEEVKAMAIRNQKLLILQRELETKLGWNTLTLGIIGDRHALQMELEKITKMIQDTGAAMKARVETIQFYGMPAVRRDQTNVDELIRYLDEALGNKKEGISSIAGMLAKDLGEATQVIKDWEQSLLDAQQQSLALYYTNKSNFGEYTDYIKGAALVFHNLELGPNPDKAKVYYSQLHDYRLAYEADIRNGTHRFSLAQNEELMIQQTTLDKKISMIKGFTSEAMDNLDKVSRYLAKAELNKTPIPDELKPERLGQAYRTVLEEAEKSVKTLRAEALKDQASYYKELTSLAKEYTDLRKKQEQEVSDLMKPSNTSMEQNVEEMRQRALELMREAADMGDRGLFKEASKLNQEAAAKIAEAIKLEKAFKDEKWKSMSESDKSYWASQDEYYRRTKKNEEDLALEQRTDPTGRDKLERVTLDSQELMDLLKSANQAAVDAQAKAMELVAQKQQKNRDYLIELNELSEQLEATWTRISAKVGLHAPAEGEEGGPDNESGAVRGATLVPNYRANDDAQKQSIRGVRKEIDFTSGAVGQLDDKVRGYVKTIDQAISSNGSLSGSLASVGQNALDADKFLTQLGVKTTKSKPISGDMKVNPKTGIYEFVPEAKAAGELSDNIDKATDSLLKYVEVRKGLYTNDPTALGAANAELAARKLKGLESTGGKAFKFLVKEASAGKIYFDTYEATIGDIDRALAQLNETRKDGEKLSRKDVFSLQSGKSYEEYEKLLKTFEDAKVGKKNMQDFLAQRVKLGELDEKEYKDKLADIEATTGTVLRDIETKLSEFGGLEVPPVLTDEFTKALAQVREEMGITKNAFDTMMEDLRKEGAKKTRTELEGEAERNAVNATSKEEKDARDKEKARLKAVAEREAKLSRQPKGFLGTTWDWATSPETRIDNVLKSAYEWAVKLGDENARTVKQWTAPSLEDRMDLVSRSSAKREGQSFVASDAVGRKVYTVLDSVKSIFKDLSFWDQEKLANSIAESIRKSVSDSKVSPENASKYISALNISLDSAGNDLALTVDNVKAVGAVFQDIRSAVDITPEMELVKGNFVQFGKMIDEAATALGKLTSTPLGITNPNTPVLEKATGGSIPGYGGGDTVPAMLEPGEFVIRKEAVAKHGIGKIAAINRGDVQHFSAGGEVQKKRGWLDPTSKNYDEKAAKEWADSEKKFGYLDPNSKNFDNEIWLEYRAKVRKGYLKPTSKYFDEILWSEKQDEKWAQIYGPQRSFRSHFTNPQKFAEGGPVEEDTGWFSSVKKWVVDWQDKKDRFEAQVQKKLAPIARHEVPGGNTTDQLLQDYHDVMMNGMNSIGIMASSMAAHPIDTALFLPKLAVGLWNKGSGGILKIPGQEEAEAMVDEVFHIPTAEELFANPLGPAMTAGILGGVAKGAMGLRAPKASTIANSAGKVMTDTLKKSERVEPKLHPAFAEEALAKAVPENLNFLDRIKAENELYTTLENEISSLTLEHLREGTGIKTKMELRAEAFTNAQKKVVVPPEVAANAMEFFGSDVAIPKSVLEEVQIQRAARTKISEITPDMIQLDEVMLDSVREEMGYPGKRWNFDLIKSLDQNIHSPIYRATELGGGGDLAGYTKIGQGGEKSVYVRKGAPYGHAREVLKVSDPVAGLGELQPFNEAIMKADYWKQVDKDLAFDKGVGSQSLYHAGHYVDANGNWQPVYKQGKVPNSRPAKGYEIDYKTNELGFVPETGDPFPNVDIPTGRMGRNYTRIINKNGAITFQDLIDVKPDNILTDNVTGRATIIDGMLNDYPAMEPKVVKDIYLPEVYDQIWKRAIERGEVTHEMRAAFENPSNEGWTDLSLKIGGAVPSARKYLAEGGGIPGFGGGDTVPALLEPGEFVLRKEAVSRYGLDQIAKLNKMGVQKLATGGLAKPKKPGTSSPGVSQANTNSDSNLTGLLTKVNSTLNATNEVLAGLVKSMSKDDITKKNSKDKIEGKADGSVKKELTDSSKEAGKDVIDAGDTLSKSIRSTADRFVPVITSINAAGKEFKSVLVYLSDNKWGYQPTNDEGGAPSTPAPKRFGGYIGYAFGGRLGGGYGGGDRIPIMGEAGEFMLRKESVAKYGIDFISSLNSMKVAPDVLPATVLSAASINTAPTVQMAAGGLVAGGLKVNEESVYNLNLNLGGNDYPVLARKDVIDLVMREVPKMMRKEGATRR